MSACVPIARREVVLREHYPDGLRDTLACGHVVYVVSLVEVEHRLCLLCIRSRKPHRHPQEERPSPHPE